MSGGPALVLVAHGTRNPRGVAVVHDLAAAVRARGVLTTVAFVDVLGPTPAEALRTVDGPAVLLPAFLASGYHVRVDVPAHVRAADRDDVSLAPALGPDPLLAAVLLGRLAAAGHRRGDAVVMVAAGSSDPLAIADVATAAGQLRSALGGVVEVGYVATALPRVGRVVAGLRERGHRRVALAPYLLAPGRFHDGLAAAGADVIGEPLVTDRVGAEPGVDPRIVDLVLRRYEGAAMSSGIAGGLTS